MLHCQPFSSSFLPAFLFLPMTTQFLDFCFPLSPDVPKSMMESFKVGSVALVFLHHLSSGPESMNKKCWLNERYDIIKSMDAIGWFSFWAVTWLSLRPYLAHLFPPCAGSHELLGRVGEGLHFSCSNTSWPLLTGTHRMFMESSRSWVDLTHLSSWLDRKSHEIQAGKFKLDY